MKTIGSLALVLVLSVAAHGQEWFARLGTLNGNIASRQQWIADVTPGANALAMSYCSAATAINELQCSPARKLSLLIIYENGWNRLRDGDKAIREGGIFLIAAKSKAENADFFFRQDAINAGWMELIAGEAFFRDAMGRLTMAASAYLYATDQERILWHEIDQARMGN